MTNAPVKALGVYYSHDQKLLHEKKFIERIDSDKKLINMWSARGLSLYGKITVIKSLIIPKFVYIVSLLITPKGVIQHKVTRLSTIHNYQRSGLKMIDLETMVKSLRVSWLKRIFNENKGTWKYYLCHQLKNIGGLFLFHCNYDIKDIVISSKFYSELLQWWSEFREDFSSEKLYQTIIWNKKDIRVNDKPKFYKTFFNSGVILVSDLRIDLNITESYNMIAKKIKKTNFLIRAGLRLAILPFLKLNLRANEHTFLTIPPSLIIRNDDFNTLTKKSKHYYALLISTCGRAQLSKNALVLKHDFDLTEDQLEKVFLLPHIVCFEPYVQAFQYKVLYYILMLSCLKQDILPKINTRARH